MKIFLRHYLRITPYFLVHLLFSIKLKYVSIKCFRLNFNFCSAFMERAFGVSAPLHMLVMSGCKFALLLPQQVPLRNYRFYWLHVRCCHYSAMSPQYLDAMYHRMTKAVLPSCLHAASTSAPRARQYNTLRYRFAAAAAISGVFPL